LKASFIIKILPMLKTLGATGIIMEYEDMFPYNGNLSFMKAKNAYTEKEIHEILRAAFTLQLNVIPLIQTFGHLEFALKLNEFKNLRENPDSPQSLCPSSNVSMKFIDEMLSQVIKLHSIKNSNFTHIHIGCDEVYQLGQCPKCRDRIRDELFLDHIYNVASIVKSKQSHLTVIIWDDHLRHVPLTTLKNSAIGKMVQPMIWVYAEDIYRFIQSQTWEKYSQVFKTSWVAGAFKGAFGERLLIPQNRRHLENTLKWLAIMQNEGNRFQNGIQGIALTGWSRYDHFSVLCELFLSGIPSLAISLHTASNGYFDIDSNTNPVIPALTCPGPPNDRYSWVDLQKDPNLLLFSRCIFPGSSIFRHITRLSSTIDEARQFIDSIKYSRGWLTDYNIRHNFSSSSRVFEIMEDKPRIEAMLINSAKTLSEVMSDFYDDYTIGEFIEQNIYPFIRELDDLDKKAQQLRRIKNFPVRPLPYSEKYFKDIGMM
jgi:hexosaminidase